MRRSNSKLLPDPPLSPRTCIDTDHTPSAADTVALEEDMARSSFSCLLIRILSSKLIVSWRQVPRSQDQHHVPWGHKTTLTRLEGLDLSLGVARIASVPRVTASSFRPDYLRLHVPSVPSFRSYQKMESSQSRLSFASNRFEPHSPQSQHRSGPFRYPKDLIRNSARMRGTKMVHGPRRTVKRC